MTYGISIPTAIGSDNITDLTSFRVFATEVKTETVTNSAQTFTYTAPSGWTSTNGTFYVLPQTDGLLPNFATSGTTSLEASFDTFSTSFKATSWKIFWLVKTGTDTRSGYGIYISNDSGETVISDDTETLLVEDSGTLSSYTTTNSGMRLFGTPSGFSKTDSAVFVKVPDGADFYAISRLRYNETEDLDLCSTTETSLDYFVVRGSFNLTAPTGYGIAIFNSSGDLCYTDKYDLFPSNGQSYTVTGGVSSATVDSTKDIWVCLFFGIPAPFCPDGGAGGFPTFNNIRGVTVSGTSLDQITESTVDDPPSTSQVGTPHDNTAIIVQR